MDSVIEVQRQTHEEVERLERALAQVLAKPSTTQQGKLANEHKASQILDRIISRAHTLNNLYQDEAARKAEIDAISGSKADDMSEFYSRLGKIKEFHMKYPDQVVGGFELELAALVNDDTGEGNDDQDEEEDPISLLFSGEEAYGRYLDLYTHHTAYANLKNIGKPPSYLRYLDILAATEYGLLHQELPIETRHSREYEDYITGLYSYLLSFAKKTQPLVNVDGQQRTWESEFSSLWIDGKLPGWENPSSGKPNGAHNGEEGIWCSACQKHYSKQTVYDAHLTSKKHVKAAARQTSPGAPSITANQTSHDEATAPRSQQKTKESRIRNSALQTFLATKLLATMLSTLTETKSNVERRFSLTAKEREAELIEKAKPAPAPTGKEENANEEEEEEERIYNPLKVPLGWDGKPIPYWLFKLHGLGVEYRCEICSDHVYMGRKNFDRHFQESRHAFGMRALGLPNTKHFHEITRIEDALALAEKLKREGKQEIFQQETMEELEDDEGNVYDRKTYMDLKKQGLI
ncbi:hypothetical protein A7U60_g8071 [Sanghuangporus baumii]|uniref:C2H2-type domain-containing protein n=1 Tax=Sanghuangporus baumii TaxID=108892 RepID=A0A9Q5HRW4_SANBA|nr:hypothetical protein A7U60_g8071 [Sanghuangporus baumii]